ncbi:MAG: hypothetical protein II225_04270, partial [Ruminococcus sp.]|nr:hypothetical protein [Ruminococcus sp.]
GGGLFHLGGGQSQGNIAVCQLGAGRNDGRGLLRGQIDLFGEVIALFGRKFNTGLQTLCRKNSLQFL